jgi:methyltransferase (TIGR00027 family)
MVSTEQFAIDTDPISGVGQTSLLIAAWRAQETERIDPLFVDSIANIFVTPAMAPWIDRITAASVSTRTLVSYRTRYFDDCLRSEQRRGVAQFVFLGAGLDTRALRLGADDAAIYEIDRAEVLAYKRRQLERHGYTLRSELIAGDYLHEDVFALLRAHGFASERETYVIWEGNTMYLPAEAIVGLLTRLRREVPRCRISFDYLSEELIRRRTGFAGASQLVDGFANLSAPWVTGFADIRELAARAGFAVVENKWIADVVGATDQRLTAGRELFRDYSVCTLSTHG